MSRRSGFLAVVGCAVALLSAASGCGPSLRRVHQGNVYFERCYAADLDVLVPALERRACWQAWHAHYQPGASPERIDHATERLAMLDPAQAAAIALATGVDPVMSVDTPSETALVEIVSAEPETVVREPEAVTTDAATGEPVVEAESDPALDAAPDPTEVVEEPMTHEAIVEASERERAVERRSHRSILAPRSTTPHCARTCQPLWERCAAMCLADERGCVGACRRELEICSRGCY